MPEEVLMKDKLKLLAILAHPDDESLGMGGSLAKYAAEGVETADGKNGLAGGTDGRGRLTGSGRLGRRLPIRLPQPRAPLNSGYPAFPPVTPGQSPKRVNR